MYKLMQNELNNIWNLDELVIRVLVIMGENTSTKAVYE